MPIPCYNPIFLPKKISLLIDYFRKKKKNPTKTNQNVNLIFDLHLRSADLDILKII